MKKTNLILVLLMGLIASSCEDFFIQTIEYTGEQQKSLIVLNSLLDKDSTIQVNLSKSTFVLNTNEMIFLNNGTVKLYVEDAYVEDMSFTSEGNYISSLKGEIGKKYKVEANVPGYDPVVAENFIPSNIQILSVDTSHMSNQWGDRYIALTVSIKDNADEENFYKIVGEIKQVYDYGDGNVFETIYEFGFASEDPLLNPNAGADIFNSEGESSPYFSDELINGEEYQLKINLSEYYFSEDTYIKSLKIKIYSYTKDTYLFVRSRDAQYNDFIDNPFSDPVPIYSNIEGGIGIFGGRNATTYRLL